MEVDIAVAWERVCSELSVSMSQATFEWWIKPCFIKEVAKIDEERVIVQLSTPSAFHVRTIDERYYGQIRQALEKQLDKKCELALIVGVKQETKVQKQEADKESGGLFQTKDEEYKLKPISEVKGLYPRYTFDSYIVGSSNNLAYAAARAVVEYPGIRHNPLFIWGGVGVGKTHLMQAVGHELAKKNIKKVTYITSEQFTNDLVNSLRMKNVDAFKSKYREVGALLIDDVQFFAGKEASQEEFFHTFNQLYMNQIQIVMTSDRKPQEIDKLEERLVSRFLGGLTVDIGIPDFEMRVAILSQKALEMKVEVDREVINLVAENVATNSRELEGLFVRLVNEASINGGRISKELVEKTVGIKSKHESKRLRPQQVISLVAKHFDFKNKDILGKSRKAELVLARHITIYFLRDELGLQLTKVGELMGGRDHTTIMHASEKIKSEYEIDQKLREKVMKIRQEMYL